MIGEKRSVVLGASWSCDRRGRSCDRREEERAHNVAISGHQWSSVAISGHQRSSVPRTAHFAGRGGAAQSLAVCSGGAVHSLSDASTSL